MAIIALFPGSFDPFTKGHYDIALRGSQLFDEIIIGIGNNANKNRYFELDFMQKKIEETFAHIPNIKTAVFEGLTADFASKIGASVLLRGLRNTTDFEYENTIAQANRHVNPQLETVFIITTPSLAFISSSIVRELHKHGSDVSAFVPYQL